MTTQEFKKANGFRLMCKRNCFNCKYHEEKMIDPHGGKFSYMYVKNYCTVNKHKFTVYADTICDKWEKKTK